MSTDQQVAGTLEMQAGGGGFLRAAKTFYVPRREDAFVPARMCERFRLRGGEEIVGAARPGGGKGGKHNGRAELVNVEHIDGLQPEDRAERKPFEDLTAIDPERRLRFETKGGSPSMRVVDLLTPIGFGQRGLICAPPRSGKTVLLQQMMHGVSTNHPEAHLIALLIDERPEEVTEMRRTVRGEVVASSNDQDVESHARLARLIVAKARRQVECGRHVVVFLDSLTRLGRAFNHLVRGGGRIMSGGLDSKALAEPKGMFGAARNAEEGGSLTIVATALIETGSRMDEVIFNEFKGTGNMEIMLSRELADRRVWPAIDLHASGTRKEEKLLTPQEHDVAVRIRRELLTRGEVKAMEGLLEAMGKSATNDDFVAAVVGGKRL